MNQTLIVLMMQWIEFHSDVIFVVDQTLDIKNKSAENCRYTAWLDWKEEAMFEILIAHYMR